MDLSGVLEFGDVAFQANEARTTVPPSTGTSSSTSLFVTPTSQAASQVASVAGGATGSKVGLLLVRSIDVHCRGVIKGLGPIRFCTKDIGDCAIKSHERKVHIEEGRYYIRCVTHGHARLEPSLDAMSDSIPEEDFMGLLDRTEPIEVWATFFRRVLGHEIAAAAAVARRGNMAMTGLEEASPDSWTDVEPPVPGLMMFRKDAATWQTPAPLVLRRVTEQVLSPPPRDEELECDPISDLFPSPDELSGSRPEMLPRWIDTIINNWAKVAKNFKVIIGLIEDTKYYSKFNFDAMEKEFEIVARKIGLLDTRIGDNAFENGTLSLWEAMEHVKAEGQRLEGLMDCLDGQHAVLSGDFAVEHTVAMKLRSDVDVLVASLNNLASNYRTNMLALKTRLEVLGRQDSNFTTHPGPDIRRTSVDRTEFDSVSNRLEQLIRRLQEDTISLRLDLDQRASDKGHDLGFGVPSTWGGRSRDEAIDLEPQAINSTNHVLLADLSARMDDMEAYRGEVIYSTHKNKFTSHVDVMKWIELNEIQSCGNFWDLFSCLIKMGVKNQSGTEQAQETFAVSRLKATSLELDLSSSMGFNRPLMLFEKDPREVDTLKCLDHESWIGTGTRVSMQDNVTADMTRMLSGIRGHLKTQTGNTALAESLLDNVDIQYFKFINFIEAFYKELTTIASFPKVSAWKLIGRCLGGFFQSMVAIRSEVSMITEFQQIDRKAQMIWAVLRCHAVVEQFISVGFKGHTVMVQQMTLYMMTERVDPSQMGRLTTTVEVANKAVMDAMKTFKQMTDALDKLKTEVADNKRKLNDLKADIDALKRRGAAAPRT